jgi:LL-diaminopimelate aminotransferase
MPKKIEAADRVKSLPPYLFARIDKLRNEVRAQGADVIDLGVGDPDMPTLEPIIASMQAATADPANHQYPAYEGSLAFRQSCADYLFKRTGVKLNPNSEILALIGSKEGIAHLPLAFVDPGDVVLVPDPGYPVYAIATRFCGGNPIRMPLYAQNGFLPDLDRIPAKVWNAAKLMFLNYPNNPTGARADESFFKHAIAKAHKYGVLIAHDAAYFEIYTGRQRPLSILEVEGGRDVSIEFFSHSKTYNMTGWRIGFAAGAPFAIDALGRVKNNVDSGAFTAVQQAAITANGLPAKQRDAIRATYAKRRKAALTLLTKSGFDVFDAGATFYVWIKTPGGQSSADFAMRALREAHVVVTPGNGFGETGEGWFRLALCKNETRVREAITRLTKLV